MLPVDIHIANLLFLKGFVTGFSANCPGLIDIWLRFGTRVVSDPVSSETQGVCGSSKIPVSVISLYTHRLLLSTSCTVIVDGLLKSSVGAKGWTTPVIRFSRNANRRFLVKKAIMRTLSTTITNVPSPTPIANARFPRCTCFSLGEIGILVEDRAGLETMSFSRPSSNFV